MAEPTNESVNVEDNEEEKKILDDQEEDDEKGEISFIEQVETALNTAKSENKLLMVLCENSKELNGQLWNHPDIVISIKKHAICLLIREGTLAYNQFTSLYPVISFPTVYCINPQNGQVLQCNFRPQDINIESISNNINSAYQKMIESQQEAYNTQLQMRQIIQQSNPNNPSNSNSNDNNNNNHPDIQNAEEATSPDTNSVSVSTEQSEITSEDSMPSSSVQSPDQPRPKKKSALSKLEQIRYKYLNIIYLFMSARMI